MNHRILFASSVIAMITTVQLVSSQRDLYKGRRWNFTSSVDPVTNTTEFRVPCNFCVHDSLSGEFFGVTCSFEPGSFGFNIGVVSSGCTDFTCENCADHHNLELQAVVKDFYLGQNTSSSGNLTTTQLAAVNLSCSVFEPQFPSDWSLPDENSRRNDTTALVTFVEFVTKATFEEMVFPAVMSRRPVCGDIPFLCNLPILPDPIEKKNSFLLGALWITGSVLALGAVLTGIYCFCIRKTRKTTTLPPTHNKLDDNHSSSSQEMTSITCETASVAASPETVVLGTVVAIPESQADCGNDCQAGQDKGEQKVVSPYTELLSSPKQK